MSLKPASCWVLTLSLGPACREQAIAAAGLASRRGADELIQAGKVMVNGEVVQQLGTTVNMSKDKASRGAPAACPAACPAGCWAAPRVPEKSVPNCSGCVPVSLLTLPSS